MLIHDKWIIQVSVFEYLLCFPSIVHVLYCCCSQAMSNSLWPHGLQHARLFYPPLSSGVCSHSHPLSGWCYLTILTSEPFSFCSKYFLALGSFPMSQFFASVGWSIGASASASVLALNIQGWIFYDWLVWSPCSPRDTQKSFTEPQFESISSSVFSLLYGSNHICTWLLENNHSFDYRKLCWQSDVSPFEYAT